MANSKKACKECKEYYPAESMLKINFGTFCSRSCALEYRNKQAQAKLKRIQSQRKAKASKDAKIARAAHRERKKELMSRAQWYDKLQRLVNQYVKIRDANEPCCTCGTMNAGIKYDAGHFIPQKGYDPRRFELTNLHKQCSVRCNQHGSGMRAEYREFIRNKYGQDHLEWLECEANHKDLKERFPTWQDIEKEMLRYRAEIKGLGVTPCV